VSVSIVLATAASPDGPAALFPWRGKHLVEGVADLAANGRRLLIVLGAEAERVIAQAVLDAEVLVDYSWQMGPGGGLRVGLDLLARDRDPGPAVVFDIGQPRIPPDVIPALLEGHSGGITAPLYKYELGFPLVIDRSRWDWFMGRVNPPLEVLAAHPDWVTRIRFDSPPPARVRNIDDAMALAP
jgi:hypothetical protein